MIVIIHSGMCMRLEESPYGRAPTNRIHVLGLHFVLPWGPQCVPRSTAAAMLRAPGRSAHILCLRLPLKDNCRSRAVAEQGHVL